MNQRQRRTASNLGLSFGGYALPDSSTSIADRRQTTNYYPFAEGGSELFLTASVDLVGVSSLGGFCVLQKVGSISLAGLSSLVENTVISKTASTNLDGRSSLISSPLTSKIASLSLTGLSRLL